MPLIKFAVLILSAGWFCIGNADELRPAYVELNEVESQTWDVTFKTSIPSLLAREGRLQLPEYCSWIQEPVVSHRERSQVARNTAHCSEALTVGKIGIIGLERTQTDALVRIQALDQPMRLVRLTSREPFAEIPNSNAEVEPKIISNVALTYTIIGVEHIVFGFDHLLFVVAIVLLLKGWRLIAWTVTAFTLAHSVTLVGTTLGWFSLPSRPVEAIIALSIVFLAVEVVKQNEQNPRLAQRYPWIVAFLFGLLHGFGFAGALAEIGLPANDRPLALFSFNLGVEIGQLAIVAVTLMLLALVRKVLAKYEPKLKQVLAYFIGTLSSFWLIERVML